MPGIAGECSGSSSMACATELVRNATIPRGGLPTTLFKFYIE
jgi:hypothetical protein